MEYKFGGKIAIEDYIQFNKHVYKVIFFMFSKKFNIILYLIIIGIVIGAIVGSTIVIAIKVESSELINVIKQLIKQPRFIFLITLLFIILLVVPFIFKLIDRIFEKILGRYCKKFYNSNKLGEFQNYNITENNINITNENENINLPKDKICKIEFDNDSIYVFIGMGMACIIKKHFFENENIFDELRIFVKENFENNTRKTATTANI